MNFRAEVYTRKQLCEALENPYIELVYTPIRLIEPILSQYSSKIILIPPFYLADCEKKVVQRLYELKEDGFNKALAHTVGHIDILKSIGFEIYGGVRLNCTNSETVHLLAEYELKDAIVSEELTAERLNKLEKPIPLGFVAYGFLPLMITRRCPIKNGKPCGTEWCRKSITDRSGRSLNVICCENTAEILNSDILMISDRLDRFTNMNFAVLKFTVEDDINEVIHKYIDREACEIQNFTRGLYFRGVNK